jgi:hypothetical protein
MNLVEITIGMEANELTIQMTNIDSQRRLFVNKVLAYLREIKINFLFNKNIAKNVNFFAFKGADIARDLSIDIATIVKMLANAITCSNQGMNLPI